MEIMGQTKKAIQKINELLEQNLRSKTLRVAICFQEMEVWRSWKI